MPRRFTSMMWSHSSTVQSRIARGGVRRARRRERRGVVDQDVDAAAVCRGQRSRRGLALVEPGDVAGQGERPAAGGHDLVHHQCRPARPRHREPPTAAPSAASRSAMERPMLLVPPAPVTRATFPRRRCALPASCMLPPAAYSNSPDGVRQFFDHLELLRARLLALPALGALRGRTPCA